MPGIGGILGAFGQAYPQYQNQQRQQAQLLIDQQNQQLNQQKLQQALKQMAVEQQARQQQGEALQKFAGMQGGGQGGVITPQQIAQAAGQSPEAATLLRQLVSPYNTGQFNIDRTQMQQQGANQRNQNTTESALERTQLQQQGAGDRAKMGIDARQNIVQQQQQGANQRNKYSVDNRKSSASSPANLSLSPEYKTAKSEYDQAKQDERAIERNYQLNPGAAYNDPQWLDARKRSVKAQQKLESIQSKAAKEEAKTPTPAAATKSEPLPKGAEQFPDGTEIPDESGAVWIKQGNVLVPKG